MALKNLMFLVIDLPMMRVMGVGYFPNRALCSQTAGLLVVPRVSKSRKGGIAFSYQLSL